MRARHRPALAGMLLLTLLEPAVVTAFGLLLGATVAATALADEPAVARARYAGEQGLASGTVFFLTTNAGAVAVGAAHSFDAAKLAASPELVFELGRTRTRVGLASRALTPLGLSFAAPGGSIATDFVVFALDAPPAGVRVLRPGRAKQGDRVQLLGIPGSVPRDEDDVFGRVRAIDPERLEVELDVAYDLRGWGGAPVLAKDGGGVLGLVQAAQPSGRTLRVLATPIDIVTAALEQPLDAGRGRKLAALAPAGGAVAPAPPSAEARGAAEPRRTAKRSVEDVQADPDPRPRSARPPVTAAAAPGAPLVTRSERVLRESSLWIEIEHPVADAITGDPSGAFVAGRALAPRGEYRNIDVVFVIDTSASTLDPSGADINGNGVVGERTPGSVGSLFGLGKIDPGDSILAAEVAAVRRLVRGLDPRSTRVGLVSFAGEPESDGFTFRISGASALTEVPLTTEYDQLQRALDRLLERGPRGATHIAAGVDQATIELKGLRGAYSRTDPQSEKIVIFLTDGQPTLPDPYSEDANVSAVLRAADRARRAGLRVYTFGIGEEALAGPYAIVRLAEITGGTFTPVRNPSLLQDVVEGVDFANLDEIRIENLTNGALASPLQTGPDGSFAGLVKLEPGRNEIQATARAADGETATARVTVQYAPDAPKVPVPGPLLARYNRVLEEHLVNVKRVRIAIEDEQAETARRELQVEIERERAKAAERAEEQRKTLKIEVEDGDDAARSR